jgi:iron complex outermembrane receptor protein
MITKWQVRKDLLIQTALVVATLGAAPIAVFAQDVPAVEESEVRLEEVTVTAQKREQNLQDVPVSVTAFSGNRIDELGITDIAGVATRTPGFTYGNFSDLKLAPTALRGVTAISSGSAGADPAVGYYLDEVYLGNGASAAIEFFDLERVEVLRGPQGTLFGRNSIGGVINITTRKPVDEFESVVNAEYGNYNYVNAKASVNIPMVPDKLAGRFSVSYVGHDGYTDNLFLGVRGDDASRLSLRGVLRFTPSDTSEWVLRADYADADQHPKLYETLYYNTDTLFYARATGEIPGLPAVPLNTDPYDREVYSDVVSQESLQGWGLALNGRIDLGATDLVSISAYRGHEYDNLGDTDMSPLAFLTDGDPEDVWRFSQEFRLESNSEGPLSWIAGLYYLRQNTKNLSYVDVGSDLSVLLVGDGSIAGLRSGSDADMDLNSYAGFGSFTYNLTERYALTLGARYTYEKKKLDYNQSDPLGLLGGDADIQGSDDWSAFTPNGSLQAFWTEDAMSYVTISYGHKSGGFNDALGEATNISYGPEKLRNYEIGTKTSWYNNRLTVNGALFHMEWEDIQIQADDPNTPIFDPRTSNAGKATSDGVEIEVTAMPVDGLILGLAASWIDAGFDEGDLPTAPGEPGIPLDKMTYVPVYDISLYANYTYPVGDWGQFFIGGEVLVQGDSYLTLDNQADGKVDAFTLLNGQIGLESNDGRWTVAIWGRNLTDEVYKQRLFDLSGLSIVGQKLINLGPPRMYGIRVQLNF